MELIGTRDAHRRVMRATAPLYVGRSRIDGRGCFTAAHIPRRRFVAELAGERITRRESRRRMQGCNRIRICDVDERTSIDTGVHGDATAFINHSCEPNLFIRVQHGHILLFALRDICAGDELSLDYGESHHNGRRSCRCGAENCRGAI
jgi:SET domain-containing protein